MNRSPVEKSDLKQDLDVMFDSLVGAMEALEQEVSNWTVTRSLQESLQLLIHHSAFLGAALMALNEDKKLEDPRGYLSSKIDELSREIEEFKTQSRQLNSEMYRNLEDTMNDLERVVEDIRKYSDGPRQAPRNR